MDKILRVQGMTCGNCVRHVTTALEGVAGVTAVTVDLDKGQATVTGEANDAALVAAVQAAGYEATTD